jgi:hypothetical protein
MAKQTFTTGQVLTAAQMTSLQQTAMGGGSTTAKTASYVLVASDAGTVVQMNSASSTTITVNTALFAAGDSIQIQNIGTGVCTITAGTATVSTAGSLALSQYEGGQLYFNTTSAALFFDIVQGSGMTNPMTTTGDTIYSSSGSTPARLGIGSTGNVLTVAGGLPTWAAPAGSSIDYTAINSGGTALTGATTITVSGISGKSSLMVLVDGASSANASSSFYVRFNSDSGGNYGAVGLVVTNTSAGNTGGYYGGDRIDVAKMTNSAGGACSFNMIVSGTNATGRKFVTASSGGDVGTGSEFRSINGWYSGTSAISSVSLISSTGNFDAGTIYVFGA